MPLSRWGFVSSKICCVLTVTTLRQRLLQPDFQPAGASQLHPRHKHLLMKRSLRCRVSVTSGFYSCVSTNARCFSCRSDLDNHFLISSSRNVNTTWASQSLILHQSSLRFSWWLCEYRPGSAQNIFSCYWTCFSIQWKISISLELYSL